MEGDVVLKKNYLFIVISAWVFLLLTGCAKQEIKQMVKPFENIPIASAKSVRFSNYTIRSENKELGRIKTVTEKQDMENIVNYIKTLSCTASNQKVKSSDYEICLSDGTSGNGFIYTIEVSKNKIYVYGGGTDPDISVYEYKDPKLISELARVYKEINYKEVLIMKK